MKGWLVLFTAASFFVAWCWMSEAGVNHYDRSNAFDTYEQAAFAAIDYLMEKESTS